MYKDLLVNLYLLPEQINTEVLTEKGITIKRVLAPDKDKVLKFIDAHYPKTWVSEADVGLTKENPTCFVAVKEKEVVGFACYDATAKGYFGPTGVDPSLKGQKIGSYLLLYSLLAMRDAGYGYAIIGSVGKEVRPFYEKTCGAVVIENSGTNKSIYNRMI